MVVLRTVQDEQLLDDRSSLSTVPVLAIVGDRTSEAAIGALRAGATGVLQEHIGGEELVAAVNCVLAGHTVLPAMALRSLVARFSRRVECDLSQKELEWIGALTEGVTVAEIAERSCYSEREMHRLLKRLYARMGVPGRTQAIALAAASGMLAGLPPS